MLRATRAVFASATRTARALGNASAPLSAAASAAAGPGGEARAGAATAFISHRFSSAAAGSAVHSAAKRSTGIVGLDVVPNAREVLIQLYEKTLAAIKVRG